MSLKQFCLHFQVSALIVKLSSCQFQIQSTSSKAVSAEQIILVFNSAGPPCHRRGIKLKQVSSLHFLFILLDFFRFGSLFQLSWVSDFFIPHNILFFYSLTNEHRPVPDGSDLILCPTAMTSNSCTCFSFSIALLLLYKQVITTDKPKHYFQSFKHIY